MAKEQSSEAKGKKRIAAAEKISENEPAQEPDGVARYAAGFAGIAGDGDINVQALRLADKRFPLIQRQELARQIGIRRGNRHL